MTLTSGARLGPYEIVEAIGAGGMGEVDRATDTRLDRTVAIKVLNPTFADDPQFHDRFDREARTISRLTHPHICTLYDIGQHEGSAYLVLEFLEGETLAARLERSKDRPLPLPEALSVAMQVADALATAHRAGIVHRDLKPGNVMLTKAGAKLLDFGLAKHGPLSGPPQGGPSVQEKGVRGVRLQPDLTAAPTLTSPLTMQGSIVGTLLYMAPEVLQGNEADARSDLFAFGVILYEMLAGRKAFSGKTQVGVMAAILEHDPPSLVSLQPSTPRALDRLVKTCLDKDPDQRWQSARDVQRELEWIAESLSELVAPGTPHPAPTAWWVAASVLLTIVAVAATWAVLRSMPQPSPQPVRFAIVPPPAQPLGILGNDRDIAISPDGRNIVYRIGTAGATPGSQLAVRALDQLDARLLAGITGVRTTFISPDGHWVAFFGGANAGELKKVSILGGPPITLCRYTGNPRGASWGPDNTIIFATSEVSTGLIGVPAGGGQPNVLTKPDAAHGEADHLFPSILPGGHAVLFTITAQSQPVENAQIAVLDLKTGQRKTLIRGGSDARYVDTGHLVYAAAGTLRAVRFDLGRLEVTSDPVPLVEKVMMDPNGEANVALSATGTLVYVPGGAGASALRSLVWVNRQGSEEPIKAPARAYTVPRLSPDGTRVALEIRDQENDIWIWDLKREALSRLTVDPGNDVWPVWTPDGQRIVFGSNRAGGVNLYARAADSTGTDLRLTTSPNTQAPDSFSPDGRSLVLLDRSSG